MRNRTSVLLLLLFVYVGATAQEDSEKLRERYIKDSSTDRQPATTAFPKYPSIARRDRIEGEATVCFHIDARGRVKHAQIKDYTHKIFRRPALKAVRQSTFEPLLPGQLLAKAKACRTYRFRLEPLSDEDE